MKITKKKRSLRKILRLVDATIILHNMLIHYGEEMKVSQFMHEEDNASDIDDGARAENQEELMKAVPEWMPNDTRRNQLLRFFQDNIWHT